MGQLPDQYGYYTGAYSTDLTNSTSRQSNYTPIPAQTAPTSTPEPPKEAEDNQNEISEILRCVQEQEE